LKQVKFSIAFISSEREGLIFGGAMPQKCNSLLRM